MFSRPILGELFSRAEKDLSTKLTGSAKPLSRSAIKVIAGVQAGLAHLAHGFLTWIGKQALGDSAEDEYLERHASMEAVSRNPATYAAGNVVFTGTDGTSIASGTIIQRPSDGVEYTTDEDATIAAGEAWVPVTCSVVGKLGNEDAGALLQMLSPIAGVDSELLVDDDGIAGGTDEESDENLRARYLERKQSPPHGGSESDYSIWAKEVSGVTRAWVFPLYLGAGTIGLCFVRDDDAGSIIPSAGEVEDLQEYIDERRPVTADVTVFAPTAVPRNFTIDLLTNDTPTIRAAVEAELEDLIRREGAPGGTLLLSHIREAISSALGEVDHVLSSPVADVTHAFGEIPVMGTITWT